MLEITSEAPGNNESRSTRNAKHISGHPILKTVLLQFFSGGLYTIALSRELLRYASGPARWAAATLCTIPLVNLIAIAMAPIDETSLMQGWSIWSLVAVACGLATMVALLIPLLDVARRHRLDAGDALIAALLPSIGIVAALQIESGNFNTHTLLLSLLTGGGYNTQVTADGAWGFGALLLYLCCSSVGAAFAMRFIDRGSKKGRRPQLGEFELFVILSGALIEASLAASAHTHMRQAVLAIGLMMQLVVFAGAIIHDWRISRLPSWPATRSFVFRQRWALIAFSLIALAVAAGSVFFSVHQHGYVVRFAAFTSDRQSAGVPLRVWFSEGRRGASLVFQFNRTRGQRGALVLSVQDMSPTTGIAWLSKHTRCLVDGRPANAARGPLDELIYRLPAASLSVSNVECNLNVVPRGSSFAARATEILIPLGIAQFVPHDLAQLNVVQRYSVNLGSLEHLQLSGGLPNAERPEGTRELKFEPRSNYTVASWSNVNAEQVVNIVLLVIGGLIGTATTALIEWMRPLGPPIDEVA